MGEMVKTRIPRIENPLDSEWPETHTRGGGALRGRRGIPAVVTSKRWVPLL